MFNTNVDTRMDYIPGDPVLINNIVSQLKSQGVFDQFRKECISDVDTKPAYQNLCHRVDGRVESYLSDVKWGPSLNKNQLRENIRKHVNECTFVDSGISRIVDQLVNPRINTVLVPKVEDIVYSYLGIERPDKNKHHVNGSAPEKNDVFAVNRIDDDNKKHDIPIKSDRSDDITLSNPQTEPPSNKNIASDFKNGVKELSSSEPTNLNSFNACSDIESDEDDMSPPFEPHEKSDVDMSAESDYSMDIPDTKCDVKTEPPAVVKLNTDCDKIFRNLERICGEESIDSATSSCTDKASSRKPSLSLDLPNTPTINYETSDESQDDYLRKNNLANPRRESVQTEICAPDTSMDSFAGKVPEDDRGSPNNSIEGVCSTVKTENKEKEGGDARKSESHVGDSKEKDSKRNEKHSERKKEHRKSDKQENSRSDKDRKSSKDKDKDRSNHDSRSRTSKEKQDRDRKSSKDIDKNKNHEKTSKDRDSKHRESSKPSSSSDKNRSSSNRTKSDDAKDDRKKKSSSSKHDSEKDRERSKHRKEESSDVKKNKTQCNTDNKKMRTDRRSSDRDSTGPSSSSRSSSHRSSSKADKEKHRHSSSSSSSSHKSKKNVETKDSGRAEDALYETMMSVTGSAQTLREPSPTANVSNIENTSSLLDILIDNNESKTSRLNASANCNGNRKSSASAEIKEIQRENEGSTKKGESKKKNDYCSEPCKSSSRKNSSPDNETTNVDMSDLETKKPKIAKNAADILRIIELRKQYKEKLKGDQLSQQQGKENTNSEVRKETLVSETDQKSILGERSIDNCVFKKTDKSEKDADETMADSFNDCKLKIKRVDAHYRLVNGSCVVDQVQSVVNNNDVNVSDNNAGNGNENTNDDKYLKQNAQLTSSRVNGLSKDCPNLKISISDIGNISNEKGHNCDTIGMRRPAITKACLMEEIDDIRYFEPVELNMDFKNFVAKRIKESEEIYLENFSIHLKCPERYDCIFRNQLGAIVKRLGGKSEMQSSPFKYNSEIIDNKVGNEKGIMMRIKKAVPENEMYTQPFGISYADHLQEEALRVMSGNSSINISNKSSTKGAPVKRRTLGVKRPLSNTSKMTNDTPSKILKLNHNYDVNGMASTEDSCAMKLGSKVVGNQRVIDGSYESLNGDQISCNSALDNPKGTVTDTSSVHSLGSSTPKIQKPISKEQKRKQFYYDANDLYKPRPSFLASSRRSRGLNPDTT